MARCPDCKCEFTRLGSHWAISDSCDYPNLTQTQRDTITGVLMGDGWIKRKDGRNPYFAVTMSNEEYLEFLNGKLDVISIGVSPSRSAEESAKMSRKSGLNPNADSGNYSDLFTLRSRSNPNLSEFANWYNSGDKVFPNNISLSPTILKHWYVCDGGMHRDGYLQIGINNERDSTEKVKEYFDDADLPTPKVNRYDGNCIIYWSVDESKELLSYMGNSVTGFEYKW
jgi:hypothetical protein